ncbi:signal peptidase II [Aliiglaciecola sp. LCG003]|uniref:signal peptidase II n=1 Tax=Aliiglaciecola sp. LCG003 TaxID=3053655 RepID=UPI002572A085|nr:signal peptidase II [Aliiglaciecola sp. LCG003]WJG08486.1 signal peptidase II [Aliiglaciecola sp. LCG003]
MLNMFSNTGLRFLWLAALTVVLDQWSKYAIVASMDVYQSIQYTSFFNLTHTRNYGAAFSFLSDASGWQRWFFTGIAVAVSVIILRWLKASPKSQILLPVAFSLILGGAIGNVYDRVAYGYVIDFLHVYYQQYDWPVFNLADSAICLGATLLIVDMFKNKQDKGEDNESTN